MNWSKKILVFDCELATIATIFNIKINNNNLHRFARVWHSLDVIMNPVQALLDCLECGEELMIDL